MKKISTLLGLIALVSCFSAVGDELPGNAIRKGSLSNQKLIQDTKMGVAAKVATLGCEKPESFVPYVLAMPQGEVGSRYWQELWVVKGCNAEYPVKIRFSETGLSGANWSIEK